MGAVAHVIGKETVISVDDKLNGVWRTDDALSNVKFIIPLAWALFCIVKTLVVCVNVGVVTGVGVALV